MNTPTICPPLIEGSITYKQFSIILHLEKPDPVSNFPDATIRGGFGITLRRLVCPTMELNCGNCILRHNCVYAFLFETIPNPDVPRMKHYAAVPHPFTLWCNQHGQTLSVSLVLIGKAIQSLPYFVYTLRKLGTQGLGKHKNHFTIQSVTTDTTKLYENGRKDIFMNFSNDSVTFTQSSDRKGSCTLNFYSPLVLRKNGAIINRYDNYAFFSTLLRRLTTLYAIHCDGSNFDDCKPLLSQWTKQIEVKTHLSRTDATRYSTRQNRHIDYAGFTGTITLSGNLGPFISFLQAGELLAVGKNTAFGFGRFRVEELKWEE